MITDGLKRRATNPGGADKTAMLICLYGTAASYALLFLSDSWELLFLSRLPTCLVAVRCDEG